MYDEKPADPMDNTSSASLAEGLKDRAALNSVPVKRVSEQDGLSIDVWTPGKEKRNAIWRPYENQAKVCRALINCELCQQSTQDLRTFKEILESQATGKLDPDDESEEPKPLHMLPKARLATFDPDDEEQSIVYVVDEADWEVMEPEEACRRAAGRVVWIINCRPQPAYKTDISLGEAMAEVQEPGALVDAQGKWTTRALLCNFDIIYRSAPSWIWPRRFGSG